MIPCVIYITIAIFTPALQQLWIDNLKHSRCTLRVFNNTALLESSTKLGVGSQVRVLRPWAYRADVWRYAQLLHTGGMFFDAELKLSRPPEDIFDLNKDKLQLVVDIDPECYFQAVMAAPKNSAELSLVLSRTISNIRARSYGHVDSKTQPWLGITGPCTMGKALVGHSIHRVGRLRQIGKHATIVDITGNELARILPDIKTNHVNGKDGSPGAHYGYLWGKRMIYQNVTLLAERTAAA